MNNVIDFLRNHWLSLVLIAVSALAVWKVYKHRDKLLRRIN